MIEQKRGAVEQGPRQVLHGSESAVSNLSSTCRGVESQLDANDHIRIVDSDHYATGPLTVGDSITVTAEYHAGNGNRVISSDEGGMRFWLRHFQSKWFPVRDIVLTDATVLGSESGRASKTITLDGLTPTAELPDGHFYQLRVSFTASDGSMHDASVYPLNIVD